MLMTEKRCLEMLSCGRCSQLAAFFLPQLPKNPNGLREIELCSGNDRLAGRDEQVKWCGPEVVHDTIRRR